MTTKNYLKLVLSSVLLLFMVTCPSIVKGVNTNKYWTTTNGSTTAWDALNAWTDNATGSGGTAFTWSATNSLYTLTANFVTSNITLAPIAVASGTIKLGGINASVNVTMSGTPGGAKFGFNNGTAVATGNGPNQSAIISVDAGKYLDLGNQLFTSATGSTGSGIIKAGSGELALAGGSGSTQTYTFGCTLNAGTLTMRGSWALGMGGLYINGGTLIMGADNLAPSSLSSISLGGDFTIGGSSSVISGTSGYSISFPNVTTTLTANRIITIGGSGTYTFAGQVTGAYGLTVAGNGGGKIVLTNTTNNFSGGTTINGSKLELGASGVLDDAGAITLGGGILSTGATTGYSETMGVLGLTSSSTIALGTGSHTITFADSHTNVWSPSTTLTITGWSGSVGSGGTGTNGKIMVGVGGLSAQQLSQIAWGSGYSGAVITASGELVPTNAPIVTPTLTPAGSASVDAAFNVTFSDDSNWRGAITGVTVNGTALTAGYSVSAGQITFTPSASVPANLLQTSGAKTIAIAASGGYADANVSQTISAGAENKVVIATQPKKATVSGGALSIQPIVNITDQYGNTVTTSTTSITASVATGTWTLGGTVTVAAVAGVVTFPDLTATYDPIGVVGVSIAFNGASLTPATSNTFNFPAAEPTATVTSLNYTSIGSNTMTINWTPAVSGAGTNHLVLVRATSDLSAGPSDNISYTANAAYGSGTTVGSGFVVYNGTGNSVTVTGLSALTTYYVRVYDFNGSGGTENYYTTGYASGSQQTARNTITSSQSGAWATPSTWSSNSVPTAADNVVINHLVTFSGSTNYCYNLTVNSGGQLSCNGGAIGYLGIYGTSMQIDGTYGDAVTETFTGLQFLTNCTLTGSGTIRINRLRPMTTAVNATFTFDADATLTNSSGVTMMCDNAGSNNIGYVISSGRTITSLGSITGGSTSSTNAAYGCTLTIDGTLNANSAIYLNAASSQSASLIVNGTLNVKTLYGSGGGSGAVPTITVNGSGLIKVTGTGAQADFTNPLTAASVTGTGTFNLDAGATIKLGAVDGLNSSTGPVRCTTRTYNAGSYVEYNGTNVQVVGADLPSTIGKLTINNAAGVSLSNSQTVTGALILTAGKLSLGANNISANTMTGSESAYVITNGAGALSLNTPETVETTFHIGTSDASYNPAKLNPATTTTTSVKVGTTLSGLVPSHFTANQVEWNITPSVASSTVVTLTPSSSITTNVSDMIGHYSNGNYVFANAVKTGNSYKATFSDFSPFITGTSDFSTGIKSIVGETIYAKEKEIAIKGIEKGSNIRVMNINGQLITTITVQNDETLVSVPSGIYMVKVGSITKKLIIK